MEGMNVRSVTGTDQREGLTIRLPGYRRIVVVLGVSC